MATPSNCREFSFEVISTALTLKSLVSSTIGKLVGIVRI